MVHAYIGLGANLGDSAGAVRSAMQAIAELPAVQLLGQSSLYGSAPVDADGADYVNAVVHVATDLDAQDLLHHLQGLELAGGRTRSYRNAPRTLDLDLLLYADLVQTDPVLTLPHPRMWQRAFVLLPLAEIAPELVSAQQLQAVQDQPVWKR